MTNSHQTDETMLVETEWLADRLHQPDLKIVDMDYGAGFAKGHIPGALTVRDNYLKSPDDPVFMMNEREFKNLMESLGIGDDTLVVAYDNNGSLYASRLWWMLTYYGHSAVRILNGGWLKWTREHRPFESAPTFPRNQASTGTVNTAATVFTTKAEPRHASSLDLLKNVSETGSEKIWDIRSGPEYEGSNSRGNARVGHVPNAEHLEWLDLMNEDHTFKSSTEMRDLLDGIGISSSDTVHIY